MSANPRSANSTRMEWPATASDAESPLREGNLAIESIARQEALRALLAFSDFHRQIRNRRLATGHASDRDLFETERFILGEVLQLICDRVLAITRADGVVVALADEASAERPTMVCRTASGPLAIERDAPLNGASELLSDCLETGRILGCDDCEIDRRAKLDSARQLGARSTVLVPLRGRRQPLGVLQVFSKTPFAFTDYEVRCFDLFAELVLSAIKPEDQDRRVGWLSDIAGEVLRSPAIAAVNNEDAVEISPARIEPHEPMFADDLLEEQLLDIAEMTPDESRRSSLLPTPSFLQRLSQAGGSHPGLSVVMGLVVVAALFSAGAWWGMMVHGKTSVAKIAASFAASKAADMPSAVTTPSAPALFPAATDNLMNPSQLGVDAARLTAVAADKLSALPKVMGVRHWSSSVGSTVVIDMEDQVPYEVHRLMLPERIYFDLHDTILAPELDGKTMDIGDPSLTRVRVAQPVAGVTRVVLDTKDGSNFSVSMKSNPYRLVVELRGSENRLAASKPASNPITQNQANANQTEISLELPAGAKAAPVTAMAAKASDQLPLKAVPVRTGKFRIVLDAGHGGWDLGTVGRQGLLEKDLVLDVTQRLGKLLQARLGSDVMFTRSDDTYLPLEQRADFANQAQADLFVSVHANYSTSAEARGVETYYTNLFSAPYAGTFSAPFSASGAQEFARPDGGNARQTHAGIDLCRRIA